MVTIALPEAPATRWSVRMRVAPLPETTVDCAGKRAGFELATVTIRLAAGVSMSPMLNGTVAVVAVSRII
jgi:hypothetical protein